METVTADAQIMGGEVRRVFTHVPTALRAENSIEAFLNELGLEWYKDCDFKNTPRRFVEAMREMIGGYDDDPQAILSKQFKAEGVDEIVAMKDIPFVSLCEHHLLPFSGVAHVGYLPQGNVVGVSKLVRLVKCFARRLQIQERMTVQIASSIVKHVDSVLAVGVVVEASHSCVACRGVATPGTTMVTSAMRGMFRDDASARGEFMRLIGR